MVEQPKAALKILRRRQVVALTGLSYSTIVRRAAEGTFPAPFKIGTTNAIGWSAAEIEQWISEQIQQKQAAPVNTSSALDALTAEIARVSPDLLVQLEGMDQPMRVADALQWIKDEAARNLELGRLIQVAADCHVRNPS